MHAICRTIAHKWNNEGESESARTTWHNSWGCSLPETSGKLVFYIRELLSIFSMFWIQEKKLFGERHKKSEKNLSFYQHTVSPNLIIPIDGYTYMNI